MEYNPKISVIIPVYNAFEYLSECLESVLGQSLNDIEIICINDGSVDRSEEILKAYSSSDNRLSYINQQNCGAGSARNKGLEIAKGRYFAFLDADDSFEPTMLQEMYFEAEKHNADIVVCGCKTFNQISKQHQEINWSIKSELLPEKNTFSYKDIPNYIFQFCHGWPWDKIYKADFIKKNKFYFQNLRTTNDMFFVFTALVKATTIRVKNKPLVMHRINNAGSLEKTRQLSWECFFYALMELKNYLIKEELFHEVEQSFVNWALNFSLWNLNTLNGSVYEKLYYKLQQEYFHELTITERDENYFYNKDEYSQYKEIMSLTISEYFSKRLEKQIKHKNQLIKDKEELICEKEKLIKEKEKLIDKTEKLMRQEQQLMDKIKRLTKENAELQNSTSYKIGRFITYIPRKIKNS
jgi:glycosyltransferase involved in cell wall biosynthesis